VKIPLLFWLAILPLIAAEPMVISDAKDQRIRDAFLGHTQKEMSTLTKEHFAAITVPEDLCWLDFPKFGMALTAYQLTGDPEYLRGFVTAFENLRSTVKQGPDGFLGWFGEPLASLKDPAKPDAVVSEIQTDFRATAVLSRFAEIVDADPALKAEFGARRDEYVALARDHLVRKWDGSFVDLGDRGAVYRWNAAYKPGTGGMSLPQEKLSIMIEGLLGLYRATGDFSYAEKAAKLGLWFKHCLEFDGAGYAWNRWNPAGPWDVSPADPKKWTTWVAKEPKAMWHVASVGSAVQLYEHGLVFDREDMKRFLKTQTSVCWNGDLESPVFFQVDGKPAKEGERFAAPSLAPFDEKFSRLIYEGPAQDFQVGKSGSPWHGGVLASGWLYGKYIAGKSGEAPRYGKTGEAFLAQASPALRKQLSFSPQPPGYMTPLAP